MDETRKERKSLMRKAKDFLFSGRMRGSKKGMAGIFYTIMGAAIALGVLIVALVLIAQLLGNVQATQTSGGLPYNITGYGLVSINTIASNTNLLALVLVFGSIIGALIGFFLFKRGKM